MRGAGDAIHTFRFSLCHESLRCYQENDQGPHVFSYRNKSSSVVDKSVFSSRYFTITGV